MIIRCVVSALNANGEPDLYFVKVNCSENQVSESKHYAVAKEQAEQEGFEAYLVYDEKDRAGQALMPLFAWDNASEVTVEGHEAGEAVEIYRMQSLCSHVRITLDVNYALHGEDIGYMRQRLQNAIFAEIGNGVLTGGSDAEVENYQLTVE